MELCKWYRLVNTMLTDLFCSSKNKVFVNFYFACSELSLMIAVVHIEDLNFISLLLDVVHYQKLMTTCTHFNKAFSS